MSLDVATWDYLPSDLNELRYAAIRSLDISCLNPARMCIQCSAKNTCECVFMHDALKKTGIDNDTFVRLKDWSNTYYQHNPRS